jgi:selenophosphate synthetase-related protein
MKSAVKRLHASTILALSASSMMLTNVVWADDTTDTKQQIEALKQQVKDLTQKIEQLGGNRRQAGEDRSEGFFRGIIVPEGLPVLRQP